MVWRTTSRGRCAEEFRGGDTMDTTSMERCAGGFRGAAAMDPHPGRDLCAPRMLAGPHRPWMAWRPSMTPPMYRSWMPRPALLQRHRRRHRGAADHIKADVMCIQRSIFVKLNMVTV